MPCRTTMRGTRWEWAPNAILMPNVAGVVLSVGHHVKMLSYNQLHVTVK